MVGTIIGTVIGFVVGTLCGFVLNSNDYQQENKI